MREIIKKSATACVAVASAATLALVPVATQSALADTTALILGGTGTPYPDQEPGYVENVGSYYVTPFSGCDTENPDACLVQSIFTPETAWPLYGGLSAPTWQSSINQGVALYDPKVRAALAQAEGDDKVVLFGYSQSGAILAIEKEALANSLGQDDLDKLQIVVIGNVSRPNGGLNGRLPITIPIVQFPYGPVMPTDTGIETTDIAMKWDIIADAPLYVLNPLAMLNALMGGPGFGIIHGTYPNPETAGQTGPGGYTQSEWQDIMNDPYGENPDGYVATHPGTVTVSDREDNGTDTTYITVTPKILPLVQPLHSIGLKPVADLIEPALRVIIEETGYDRSIPYGTPTTFRLIPIFNPVTLAFQLVPAIEQGVEQFVADLSGETETADSSLTQDVSSRLAEETPAPVTTVASPAEIVTPLAVVQDNVPAAVTDPEPIIEDNSNDEAESGETSVRTHRPFRPIRDILRNLGIGPRQSAETDESDDVATEDDDADEDDTDTDNESDDDADRAATGDAAA